MTITGLLYALLLTIAIEYAVLRSLGERRYRVLLASVVMNIATNVPLNVYLQLAGGGLATILLLEALVVVAEALAYWLVVRRPAQAAIYSLLCNAISFLIGLLIETLTYLVETG